MVSIAFLFRPGKAPPCRHRQACFREHEHHLRSVSITQELKGATLGRFLLRKLGRHWDGVPALEAALREALINAIAHKNYPHK